MTPEEQAREQIDNRLVQSGWIVQDFKKLNPMAGLGVAVREFPTSTGPVDYVLTIIIQASYFLNLLDGHSITKHGKWIPHKIDYYDVYMNMSNPFDRLKLICTLRFRDLKYKCLSKKKKGTSENHNSEKNN